MGGAKTARNDVNQTVLEETEALIEGLMRNTRPQPRHQDVLSFREQIELYVVIPDSVNDEIIDYRCKPYDITYNSSKLADLVAKYNESSNQYALDVLLLILENAFEYSKPVPQPMVPLLRDWMRNGIKKKRAASPLVLSRDRSLITAILLLERHCGVTPYRNSASNHMNSGCDIAAKTWNKIADEREARGEHWPRATYDAARDALKSYRNESEQCGGDSRVD